VPSEAAPVLADEDEWQALGATRVTSHSAATNPATERGSQTSPSDSLSGGKKESQLLMSDFGDFRPIKKLGQGAMATVYKAWQISRQRKVALKVLHKTIAANPKLLERFHREARVLAEIEHPNIVRGFGAGVIDGNHYFAMEYVSGVTLQHVLNVLGRISVGDALNVTLACAHALAYAHARGLIHRDVKPDNVMITKNAQVKLADLGMVKEQDENMALTQTGHAVGTPWYMPLEQARNAKDADGRCDIYALGCMLYYMLTGTPPFTGSNIVEVIQAKERGTFPPAHDFNPEVPERLDLILAKMTAKLAKYRYETCEELAADLEGLGLTAPTLSFLRTRGQGETSTIASTRDTPLPETGPSLGPEEWYLRQRTELGDSGVRKVKKAELLSMLDKGEIHPGTKISKFEHTGYRSLATFREFEHAAHTYLVRMGGKDLTPKYQDIYREFEESKLQHDLEDLDSEEIEKPTLWTGRTILIGLVAVLAGAFRFWMVLAVFGLIGQLWK
jgi:serine/threonine-protein kinase